MSEITQQTARELMAACEVVEEWGHDPGMPWHGVFPKVRAALAHARADLAREEAPIVQIIRDNKIVHEHE